MNDDSLISVIIPTYQRADRIGGAVESVLAQSDRAFELIVVDDGSTDDTVERLGDYGERLHMVRQAHAGVSAARNHGARIAAGEWLAFLDSDDRWEVDKLAAQRRYHRENPEIAVSQTGEIWIRDGVRVNPCHHHAKPSGDVFRLSLERCLVSPSAVMLRRDLFLDCGGFDEELPVCEDYDLWLRLGCRLPFGLIDEPLVIKYGGHSDQLSRSYWGMDRFRVRSLTKLLDAAALAGDQRVAAIDVLQRKCAVLAKGARRRGRCEEADGYDRLVRRYCGE